MEPLSYHRAGDRRGVALILVIGMLALMMVLGVTFSIFMRSERTAAGNFRADVQSRELLHVALARALDDLESSLATNAYPSWKVLQSSGSTSVNLNATSGSIPDFIPSSLIAGTTVEPKWIEGIPGGGRVSFVVLNCSGLLDANYAGGAARLSGAHANEIQISSLPGSEVPDPAALVAGRPYVNIQDLVAKGVLNGSSSNFVTYSAIMTNGLEDLSGDAEALISRQASIIQRLTNTPAPPNMGLSLAEARILFTNLIDYVDADSIPGNLNGNCAAQASSPSVEPVWMFNEVYATSTMTLAPSGADYLVSAASATFRVEAFFPFMLASKTGHKLELSFLVTNCSATCLTPAVNPRKVTLDIPSVAASYAEPTFVMPMPAGRINLQGGTHPTNTTMHMEVQVSAIVKDSGGNVVDAVTNPPVSLAWTCFVNAGKTAASGWDGKECIDPRLNHLSSSWKKSTAATGHSIQAENTAATDPLWRQTWSDQGMDMFVANRPLGSVGEMGYLFTGSSWQTLRLYRHTTSAFERKTYLAWDHFTVNTNSVQRGLVNVNTRNRDVLMSVFANMPLDYPHGTGATRLQNPELGVVVDAIMAKTAAGGITNLSELATMAWTNIWTAGTELDCESILRNSADLLTTRQQYFIILVYAQAMKPVIEKVGVVTGLRGVAEVWRDSRSPNPKFVRALQIINN